MSVIDEQIFENAMDKITKIDIPNNCSIEDILDIQRRALTDKINCFGKNSLEEFQEIGYTDTELFDYYCKVYNVGETYDLDTLEDIDDLVDKYFNI